MENSAIPSPESHALIVEGQNDLHVTKRIWRRHVAADLPMAISEKGGICNLLPAIEAEIKTPGRKVLGIIVDADDDLAERWREVTNPLVAEGIQPPDSPDPDGTVIEARNGHPRIGIWVMPDNASAGELEDFISEMIPGDDPVWPRSVAYIDGIPLADREFSSSKEQGAKVYA